MEENIIISRMKSAMALQNMSAAELARRSGLDRSAISRYLSGKIIPKLSSIEPIAKILHVDPMWLMGYELPYGATPPVNLDISSDLESNLKDMMLEKFGSINKFATACGLPYSTVATALNRGVSNTNFSTIIKICNTLNISIDGLADGHISSMRCANVDIDINKLSKINFNRLIGYYHGLLDTQRSSSDA